LRISPRALTAMRTLSSSSWIDRWDGSGLVAAAVIRPKKGRVSARFLLLMRGKEGEGRGTRKRRGGVVERR
jgi:hypothetical protein